MRKIKYEETDGVSEWLTVGIEDAVRQRRESVMNKCWSRDGEAVVCQLCFHKWSVKAETAIAGSALTDTNSVTNEYLNRLTESMQLNILLQFRP